jgi:hypothetical protein
MAGLKKRDPSTGPSDDGELNFVRIHNDVPACPPIVGSTSAAILFLRFPFFRPHALIRGTDSVISY